MVCGVRSRMFLFVLFRAYVHTQTLKYVKKTCKLLLFIYIFIIFAAKYRYLW